MPKRACNSQNIAELTRICQAQSEELSAKDVIITYLQKQVRNLEETLAQKPVSSCAADTGVLTQTNGRKRAAPIDELQTPQRKVAKNQASSFLKAASDQMKSCIQWGGILEVKFTTCVELGVFNKVFDGCPRSHAAGEQEPGEMPEPGELVLVSLDRDEMLRVFGKPKAGRRFRFSGQGTIDKLTVTYDRTSKTASGNGTWVFSQHAD
ncbi:hypothetical protein WJX79_007740 [Trebouxia sp. C0005]